MRARHRVIQYVVPAALCLGSPAVTAERPARIDLVVALRVVPHVPAAVVREARTEVERTFLASGVRIVWAQPGESSRRPPLTVIVCQGTTPAPQGDDGAGETVLGMSSPSGEWAHVYYRRVAAIVADRQVPIGVVLAHVISHELGHMLLPPDSHAPIGVMRRDVPLEHPSLRLFTDEQSRLIRAAIASGRRCTSRCGH
jgi:hypothetical protein